MSELPGIKAVWFEGERYVREKDCRAEVSAAFKSKKPLIAQRDELAKVLKELEQIVTAHIHEEAADEWCANARAAIAKLKGGE